MTAEILKPTQSALEKAAGILRQSGVVGMPTETVYGLAGFAFSEEALTKIFKTKARPAFDPLIVHIAPPENSDILDWLSRLELIDGEKLPPQSRRHLLTLAGHFWPGPLTLVLPKNKKVPDLATSGLPTVAIRMPSHPAAQALLKCCGQPLAAPSANRFGKISPTTAQHVFDELGDQIPLILDGDSSEIGLESTVVALTADGGLTLLRPGRISAAELKEKTGCDIRVIAKAAGGSTAQSAPGMLASHYAPNKKLMLLKAPVCDLKEGAVYDGALPETLGLLTFGPADKARKRFEELTGKEVFCESLSESGCLDEAAKNLFSTLRRLDQSKAGLLFTEPCLSEEGIGHAIADRLRRASF